MSTYDAVLILKDNYQDILAKDLRRFGQEIEPQNLIAALTKSRDISAEYQQQANPVMPVLTRPGIGELEQKVNLIAPQLARLLNQRETFEIVALEYTLCYEPETQNLHYQDRIDPQQYFSAIWSDGQWLVQSGYLLEEKVNEILATVSRNLEIIKEQKQEIEVQQVFEQEM